MTDTIEAPATEAGRGLFRAARFQFPIGTHEAWRKEILAIEQQARDEGRQEAVRLAKAQLPALTLGGPLVEGLNPVIEVETVRRILDDVARPGRSSDPTEADDE